MTLSLLSAKDLHVLSMRALIRAGTRPENAELVANALIRAELDGLPSHGVMRVPYYAEQVRRGRVDGWAVPRVTRAAPSVIRVDARHGFAYPAIAAGLQAVVDAVAQTGVGVVTIGRSHHSGVAGHHVEDLASRGLVAVMFTNNYARISAAGGRRPRFGTNPIAFACPRPSKPPLVVDLSMTVVAAGKIVMAARQGDPIPAGWAYDAQGEPTCDPARALDGSMAAIGGTKGAALALVVEILAAALTGSQFSFEAASEFGLGDGPRYSMGQVIIAIDPLRLGPIAFFERIEVLCSELLQEGGVRLPGDRRLGSRQRLSTQGISVPTDLVQELRRRAGSAASERIDVRVA
jgi:(2R)-3-sulfolactate dehydrogenase (NADP+)